MTFQISIANVCVRITSIYRDVYDMCCNFLDYLHTPEFSIELCYSNLLEEARRNGEPFPLMEDRAAYMETLAVYRLIAERLLDYNILLIHGVLLNCSGSGILITAPSGVGKTTRAKLWKDLIPDTYIINGDKPLLVVGKSIIAYGTPWNGKENIGCNESVPLCAICLLRRCDITRLTRINPKEFLRYLLKQVYLPTDGNLKIRVLSLFNRLCEVVPIYLMECDIDPMSVNKIYKQLCSDNIISPLIHN